ncbi:ciliogenesis-associated TTC17-interacting protein-like isoform X1 [Centruroides sculpturatus]|uniref:ciliogenesis-associated TTC17-interacting protein-like isoform X1 n=1 Tax=Centruroides sculpturatus TaxID=218467 RepID=UPI000C6D66AC|nr:ciliogenesis-associated TTC17-interacting protein-like isoform X1 [Centruroides sculpturatus]
MEDETENEKFQADSEMEDIEGSLEECELEESFLEEEEEIYKKLTKDEEIIARRYATKWMKAINDSKRKFFENIDPEIVQQLIFPDCLAIFTKEESVGEFVIVMGRINRENERCILIHVNNSAVIDDVKYATDITTICTTNLETLQQVYRRTEESEENIFDQRIVLLRDEKNYTVKKIIFNGQIHEKITRIIPREELPGFISEGASFLLHRYILKTKMKGPFCLNGIDTNLGKCTVTFVPLEEMGQTIQRHLVYIVGVKQKTTNFKKEEETWTTYYNHLDFHMTQRKQSDSPVEMVLVRLPIGLGRAPPNFLADWESNPQLWSYFNERKAAIVADYMEYLHRNPEVKALLSDFLLFLLHKKPSDICDAAAHFFNDYLKDY